jgi:thiosulfate dehydrogenase [quinone] large subunit
VLVLRAFFGVTFLFAGLQKLANPAFFNSTNPTGIHQQMRFAQSFSPIGDLLGPAAHISTVLGVAIALGEIAVGLATLIGFRTRLAAIGGMLLSLSFFLTVSWNSSPYYYGADIVFFFAWTTILLAGPSSFSLDAWLRDRDLAALEPPPGTPRRQVRSGDATEVGRRAVMQRLGVTAAVAAVVVALGGVTAAIGRALGAKSKTAARGSGGSNGTPGSSRPANGGSGPATTPVTTSSATTTSAPAGKPKGTLIGPAAAVPVAGARSFMDTGGRPAYIVQPQQGVFLGFSRICTHQGCTVDFAASANEFRCPCHGSVYSASTGAVLGGPAPSPLPKITVVRAGDGNLYATD